ncbi:MAG: hypothetical protein ACE5JJ_02405 [Nitrospinota bacterium]
MKAHRRSRRVGELPAERGRFWVKLVLPLAFLLLVLSLPFFLIPEDVVERGIVRFPGAPEAGRTPSLFQQWMQLGIAFLLVPLLVGGWMLYTITRHQSRTWARRFGPGRRKEQKPPPPSPGARRG